MSDLRAAAQQALEALMWHDETVRTRGDDEAIEALRAALEQPEQPEPVAWQWLNTAHFRKKLPADAEPRAWNPLYTHPPRREPLSDEELDRLWREPMSADWGHREYARAVEAAHGIKENT